MTQPKPHQREPSWPHRRRHEQASIPTEHERGKRHGEKEQATNRREPPGFRPGHEAIMPDANANREAGEGQRRGEDGEQRPRAEFLLPEQRPDLDETSRRHRAEQESRIFP